MRVIILAAGIGSRLLPITLARPKGLIELHGQPLLSRTLELLAEQGCQDVVCVSGYYASSLERALRSFPKRPRLKFIRNREFDRTNSIVSLALTTEWWDRDFLLIDSDLWFEDYLVSTLVNCGVTSLLIDSTKAYSAMDMKVEVTSGAIHDVSKNLPAERTSGEFFGMSYWTKDSARELEAVIRPMILDGGAGEWYEAAISRLATGHFIAPVQVPANSWFEIDTLDDLEAAKLAVAARQNRLGAFGAEA